MRLKSFIAKFFKRYFFNSEWVCLSCGREIFGKEKFCEQCLSSLPLNDKHICGHCGRAVIASENYCTTCKNNIVHLDRCRSYFVYKKPVSDMIQRLKYNNQRYLVDYFADCLKMTYLHNYFNADYFAFVPMTEKAKKKRGYNQSQLLANALSQRTGVPVFDGIVKIKETKRQATLNRRERLKNLQEAFRIKDKKLIKEKTVVIIDDVTTTGATAEVIAERLKSAGAKQVYLITVASTSPIDGY